MAGPKGHKGTAGGLPQVRGQSHLVTVCPSCKKFWTALEIWFFTVCPSCKKFWTALEIWFISDVPRGCTHMCTHTPTLIHADIHPPACGHILT